MKSVPTDVETDVLMKKSLNNVKTEFDATLFLMPKEINNLNTFLI